MKRFLILISLNLMFLYPMLTQAEDQVQELPTETSFKVQVKPGKSHEICFKAEKGDTLEWSYDSTQAVDMNIHHHMDGEVFTPISNKDITKDKDSIVLNRADNWCLMWKNISKSGTSIKGKWSLKKSEN